MREKADVILRNGYGSELAVITAEVIDGVFAIHRPVDVFGRRWSVTHVPTGLAVAKRLRTKASALTLANNLLGLASVKKWRMVRQGKRVGALGISPSVRKEALWRTADEGGR